MGILDTRLGLANRNSVSLDSQLVSTGIIQTIYMGILVVMIFLEFHLVDCMHAFHWLSSFADSLQNSDPSLIGQLLKKTSLIMSQVSDTFELSGELRSAIKDENISEIRWGW